MIFRVSFPPRSLRPVVCPFYFGGIQRVNKMSLVIFFYLILLNVLVMVVIILFNLYIDIILIYYVNYNYNSKYNKIELYE